MKKNTKLLILFLFFTIVILRSWWNT